MPENPIVNLHIHCHSLPGLVCGPQRATRLGTQCRDVVEQDVPADRDEVTFVVQLTVRQSDNGAFDFGGPYVHGVKGKRFVYLNWGERHGGQFYGFGRVKVQLEDITSEQIATALKSSRAIQTSLPLTNAKGANVCASVYPEFKLAE